MKTFSPTSIIRDCTGGVMAGLLALPESLAYGILVFSPLGKEGVVLGITSGLSTVVFSNIVPSFFPGSRILSSGPFSLSSVMLSSVCLYALEQSAHSNVPPVTIVFFTVFLCGIFQTLFGILRIGYLAKFVPQPVISGLINGTALLIIIVQVRPLLVGNEDFMSKNVITFFSDIKFFPVLVIVSTCIVALFFGKFKKCLPGPLAGIFAGCFLYYTINYITSDPVFALQSAGTYQAGIPSPAYGLGFQKLLHNGDFLKILGHILPMAFGISLIISMRTLLAVVCADNVSHTRTDSNLELIGQGAGHMIASFFGGIASAGSISRSLASRSYGGSGRLSRVTTGIFALLTMTLLSPVLTLIPELVLTGLLLALAISSFDKWIFGQLKFLINPLSRNKSLAVLNVAIIPTVAASMIFIGTFEAVALGLGLSLLYFIFTMTRNIVRDTYDASLVRSNHQRVSGEIQLLESEGRRIVIIELDGPLFFGTADRLADKVYRIFEQALIMYLILDFKRVPTIDSTGLHILQQLKILSETRNKNLLLAGLDNTILSYAFTGLHTIVFPSVNDALANAENALLRNLQPKLNPDTAYTSIFNFEVFSLVDRNELVPAAGFFRKMIFLPGRTIFSQNECSSEMYLLSSGHVHINIRINEKNELKCISTVCPGTIFGEMALIDGKPRSAYAIADTQTPVTCFCLSREKLQDLCVKYPATGLAIITGITSEISRRVRVANNTLSGYGR